MCVFGLKLFTNAPGSGKEHHECIIKSLKQYCIFHWLLKTNISAVSGLIFIELKYGLH